MQNNADFTVFFFISALGKLDQDSFQGHTRVNVTKLVSNYTMANMSMIEDTAAQTTDRSACLKLTNNTVFRLLLFTIQIVRTFTTRLAYLEK